MKYAAVFYVYTPKEIEIYGGDRLLKRVIVPWVWRKDPRGFAWRIGL